MRTSRPGGTRAGRRAAPAAVPIGRGAERPGPPGSAGAGWRLAALLLAALALSGHGRPVAPRTTGHDAIAATLAEIRVELDGRLVARGSAVVVAAREEGGESACYVLTVGHVLSAGAGVGARLVVVLPGDSERQPVPAEPLGAVDRGDRDLAVLRAVAAPCRPARVGPPLPPGSDVWLAGFPASGASRVFPGHVRDVARDGQVWTVDGVATEGTSGGGVFDAQSGGLVGLIQGYWAVRLVAPSGRIAGEAPAGRIAVIPIGDVRGLLAEWGFADLLEDERPATPRAERTGEEP